MIGKEAVERVRAVADKVASHFVCRRTVRSFRSGGREGTLGTEGQGPNPRTIICGLQAGLGRCRAGFDQGLHSRGDRE
jgi:hypothetical protein